MKTMEIIVDKKNAHEIVSGILKEGFIKVN